MDPLCSATRSHRIALSLLFIRYSSGLQSVIPGRSWPVLVGAVPSDRKAEYMAENVGQKEGRLSERSADSVWGGTMGVHLWTTGTPSGALPWGLRNCVRMRFSQMGNAISKRFRELEPHRRVGGFRKFGGQEFEMHEEGQFATPWRLYACKVGSSESETNA